MLDVVPRTKTDPIIYRAVKAPIVFLTRAFGYLPHIENISPYSGSGMVLGSESESGYQGVVFRVLVDVSSQHL